jgi:iduronate 2-sulfatase
MRLHYYGAVSFMDNMLGQLLDALDDTGRADQTLVIFHADHGWALGENNMFRKFHNAELTTRVPLLIAVRGFRVVPLLCG